MNFSQFLEQTNMYYHVTKTENLPRIKAQGLVPMQNSNWVQAGNKERYGNGEIYVFEQPADAIKWAAKMDWEFYKKLGSGNISIVFLNKTGAWDEDKNDPVSQLGSAGKWLKRMQVVPAADIHGSVQVTLPMIKSGRLQ